MKIFKYRGDIYFSKANKEKSKEQKILIIALAVIVAFTVLFVTVLCITNNFSAKKFFAPEKIETTVVSVDDNLPDLPQVSGKSNFITAVSDKDTLLFVILTQTDMDNKAFKVSVLKAGTELDGNTLGGIFASSGVQNVVNAVEAAFDCEFEYYMSFEKTDFQDFFNSLGEINYPVINDIKYRDDSASPYTLKMKAGEQKINGQHFVNMIRYYVEAENSTSQASELVLTALTQQLNSENMENSEKLFKSFSALADTNISIRDFSSATNALTVITNSQASMSVYSAGAEYDGNKITAEGLKSVKGYFVK